LYLNFAVSGPILRGHPEKQAPHEFSQQSQRHPLSLPHHLPQQGAGLRSVLPRSFPERSLRLHRNRVKRSFIPLQAIVRIDEVEKEGVATISKGDNIAPFPLQIIPRGNTQQE
jgi:hypothetical protein